MKMQIALKPIALLLTVIAIAIPSFAQAAANHSLTFCYSYSGSTMVLNPTPLAAGEKCRANDGFIYAPNVASAKNQIDKSNRGNVISDCNSIYQGCLMSLKRHSNVSPDFAKKICVAKKKACLNPNNKDLKAKLDNLLQTVDPKVADMVRNLRPE